MRKPDEIALYAFMRESAKTNPTGCTASTNAAANALGMSHNRAHYLVDKWCGRWCDGCSTNFVYFYNDAPAALLPWGVVQ